MHVREGVTIGSYHVVAKIGRGGMATVYRAYHPGLDRYVAIKVLPDLLADDTGYQERFQQEARSVARLKHPNILEVFDFGYEDGLAYLVLELVEGGTLADRVGRPMELRETVGLLEQLAGALDHAHSRGILHRDLKPSNILLREDGTPVLADFGLARMLGSLHRMTQGGTVMGTPEYMSPEQASDEAMGPASDIYSFAVVAYEMLTVRVPFQADTPAATLLSHVTKAMPATRELRGELSAHIEEVLRRALAKRPEERYASAAAFVAALKPAAWPSASKGESQPGLPVTRRLAPAARVPVVLVVDDGPANRELIEACLAGVDCQVRSAEDGTSALKAIQASPRPSRPRTRSPKRTPNESPSRRDGSASGSTCRLQTSTPSIEAASSMTSARSACPTRSCSSRALSTRWRPRPCSSTRTSARTSWRRSARRPVCWRSFGITTSTSTAPGIRTASRARASRDWRASSPSATRSTPWSTTGPTGVASRSTRRWRL